MALRPMTCVARTTTLHIHRPNAHPHIRRKVPYFNSFGSSELHTQTSQRIGFIASSSGSVLR